MTKNDLKGYCELKKTKAKIQAEIKLLEQEKVDICQIGATRVSDMPTAKGGNSDPTAKKVFEVEECSERLNVLRHDLNNVRWEMDDIRNDIIMARVRGGITSDEANILLFFYINSLTIEVIAEGMNISESTVKRLKNKGIANLTLTT